MVVFSLDFNLLDEIAVKINTMATPVVAKMNASSSGSSALGRRERTWYFPLKWQGYIWTIIGREGGGVYSGGGKNKQKGEGGSLE